MRRPRLVHLIIILPIVLAIGYASLRFLSIPRHAAALSYLEIFVHAKKYEGWTVVVTGYLSPTFELYDDKLHFDLLEAGIPIVDPSMDASIYRSSCGGNYAEIVGTIRRQAPPGIGYEIADVKEIRKISLEPEYKIEPCWEAKVGRGKVATP